MNNVDEPFIIGTSLVSLWKRETKAFLYNEETKGNIVLGKSRDAVPSERYEEACIRNDRGNKDFIYKAADKG